ncbi:MAG: hypothetical protein ACRDL7_05180, partial [Gaiellaceae bacterium]
MPAAEYWRRAGDQALRQAAYVEAMRQLERGIGLLRAGVPDSTERARTEVELLTTSGTVLFMTKGYSTPEVENTFAQAWELCERRGEDIPLKVLFGMWGVQITRSNYAGVEKLIPRAQRLLTQTDDLVSVIIARSMLGANAFWRGNLVEAGEHLTRGRELYGTEAFERFTREYGYDAGLYLHGFAVFTLWQLGYPDRALAVQRELLAIAEQSRSPYSIALALGFGVVLAKDRGDTDAVLAMTDRLMALASEQHFHIWAALALANRGEALSQHGAVEEALPVIQQGLAIFRAAGFYSMYGFYLTHLAAAHLRAGQTSEGLRVVDEGLQLCKTLVSRYYEAELRRLQGELLLQRGDCDAAEAALRWAVAVARQKLARSYELRGATSLSRMLHAAGKGAEAQSLLQ